MQAGELDRRITIEQNTPSGRDDHGQNIDSWSLLATVWARVSDRRGRERFTDDRELAYRTITFRIRWRSDVTDTKIRIQFDDRTWDVTAINEIGRRDGIDIDAEVRGN